MNIFEQLEKIKKRGFIGGVAFIPDDSGTIVTVAGFGKDMLENLDIEVPANEGETIEQVVYRAILEFDEKYPE